MVHKKNIEKQLEPNTQKWYIEKYGKTVNLIHRNDTQKNIINKEPNTQE